LMNLAINARDAMPEGGSIRIATANADLRQPGPDAPAGLAPGNYVKLSVSDTGTGMDQATQSRIFEPFFSTKGPDKGTGLGLATVYSIIKQNQGALQLRSAPGQGSTFSL